MDMDRIIGLVLSGFMCKAISIGMGIWIAHDVISTAVASLNAVATVLPH